VVGAGGAGFPTHVKLSGKAGAVQLNQAECEPLLHKDKELLHAHDGLVLEGLRAAMRLVGAAVGWVGIREKYHEAIDAHEPRLPRDIRIAPLRDQYSI
jgi:Na+-translocating ferredoxin:NAD+ oxidoreductase RnfC subunit